MAGGLGAGGRRRGRFGPNHANWLETFPFCRVAELPDEVKPPTPLACAVFRAAVIRAIYGDDLMQKLFAPALRDVVEKLGFG